MIAVTLGLTYLGAALCYAASPKAKGTASVQAWMPTGRFRARGLHLGRLHLGRLRLGGLRSGGLLFLGVALGSALAEWPVGEAFLMWIVTGMVAFSLLVIASPLVDRFVPASGALALTIAVLALWL